MARTLPPVQAIRAEIDALFTEGRDLVEVIEDVARLGARLIIQTAVEAEVDAFLGRARYQRAAAVPTGAGDGEETTVRPGHRNGHCPTTVKTTSGPITIARPKLRGTTDTFASRLFGTGVTRTHALETLVIASFVRGLSVRDVEGALADALGPEAALSKSTVSTICQAIVAEYDAWCRRDLTSILLTGGVLALVNAGNPGWSYLPLLTSLSGLLITTCGGAFALHSNRARKHLTEQAERIHQNIQSDLTLSQALDLIDGVEDPGLRDRLKSVTAMRVLGISPEPSEITERLLPQQGDLVTEIEQSTPERKQPRRRS